MNKHYLTLIVILLSFSSGFSQKAKSRWVLAPDPLMQLPIFNIQKNNIDENLPLGKDWIQGLGLELVKYYPNNSHFVTINGRVFQREAIVDKSPVYFFRENGFQLNVMFNKNHINKTPNYLDITKLFGGIGLSYTGIINKQLHYLSDGYVQTSKELHNNHRIEALASIGIVEDVFNISNKTSLSKLNLIFRLPIFNASNTFNNNYFEVSDEIQQLVKSNNRRFAVELQYSHLLDVRRNRRGKYETKLDSLWTEVTDPVKVLFPPVVNNGLPTKSFYGNFYFEITGFRSQDSIFVSERNQNFSLFKRFNAFGIGYTFNFFGDYKKDYSSNVVGGGIYNFDKGWRKNLFISVGYKQLILKADRDWVTFDMFAPLGTARTGIKLKNPKNRNELAFGVGYQKLLGPQTFLNHIRTETPSINNMSIFAAFGYFNNLIKLEYEIQDFEFSSPYKSLNVVYCIGI